MPKFQRGSKSMWVFYDLLEYIWWLLAHVRQGQSHLQKLLKPKTTPTFWTSTDLQNIPKKFQPFGPDLPPPPLLRVYLFYLQNRPVGWPKSKISSWILVLPFGVEYSIVAPTFFERLTQMQSNIPMWQFKPNLDQWSIYSLSPQGSTVRIQN